MAMGSAWVLVEELKKTIGKPAEAAAKYHKGLQSEIRDIQKIG